MAESIIKALKSYYYEDPLRLECLNEVTAKIADLLDISKKNWE